MHGHSAVRYAMYSQTRSLSCCVPILCKI